MASYYVNQNAQNNGDHEVHKGSCPRLPSPLNRKYLGEFTNCTDAVREARSHYSQVDGCAICSPACHTR